MAVVIETTLGDITVDLYIDRRPMACLNFLKLCKMKYYNYNLFHTIQQSFIAQTGDPTGAGDGGESIFGLVEGQEKRFFQGEMMPKIRHTDIGTLSMVSTGENMLGSQFFFTLDSDLTSLDGKHCVIGEVSEGHEILRKLNEVICDSENRPYQDVRITHTVILEDPFEDPRGMRAPSRSPSPSAERLKGGRIAPDEAIDETEGKTEEEINEMVQAREAKARATILEIVGDLPDADMAPPENVLFVCKLNPVTTDDDLEIIFSRFGKINSCEVIRDKVSGDSLQYAFVEFDNRKSCEDAYFKMDNVLIDDRRIHVDFSQSVSKIKWRGKGRGVIINEDKETTNDRKREDYGQSGNDRHYFEKRSNNNRHRNDNEDRNRRREDRSHNYNDDRRQRYDDNYTRNRYDRNDKHERDVSHRRDRNTRDNRRHEEDNSSRRKEHSYSDRKKSNDYEKSHSHKSRHKDKSHRNRSRSISSDDDDRSSKKKNKKSKRN